MEIELTDIDTVSGQDRHPKPTGPPHPFQQHAFHTQQLVPTPHHPAQNIHNANGWTPASSPSVARSRAQRRFWVAMIYAWLIYLLIGLVLNALILLIFVVS